MLKFELSKLMSSTSMNVFLCKRNTGTDVAGYVPDPEEKQTFKV